MPAAVSKAVEGTGRPVKTTTAGPVPSQATLSTTGTVISAETGKTGKSKAIGGSPLRVADLTGRSDKAGLSSAIPKAKVSAETGVSSELTDQPALFAENNGSNVSKEQEEEDETRRKMHLAHLWDQVNHCGVYQIMVFLLTVLPNFLCGFILLVNVFVLGTPHHRCKITGCDNGAFNNETAQSFSWRENSSLSSLANPYVCHHYEVPEGCDIALMNRTSRIGCTEMVYDYSSMAPSAVNEWGLVCDDAGPAQLSKAVFMSGMLFSSIICGSMADKYGRVSIYWWTPAVLVISSILSANAPGILMYTITSFMMSFCAYGMVISDFTIGVEVVPKDWRVRAGQAYPVTFALGNAFMVVIFYFCQNWRHSLIVISALSLIIMFVPLLMPESVKWRIARGGRLQHRAARKEIKRIASMNNIIVSELADNFPLDPDTAAVLSVKPPTWRETIKSKLMLRWVSNMCSGWFFAALTYYGVTFATKSLPMNFYWGFILMSFIEVPFVLSLTVLMKYFGRRTLYCSSFILAGLAALLFPVIRLIMIMAGRKKTLPDFSLYSTLAVKGFISIAFNLSYVYTVEIFPSVMRTRGLGFCSMFARVATIMSPLVADMQWPIGLDTPFVFLGILCFVYGFIALDLPETKGKELPDTLDDLSKLKNTKK